MIMRISAAAALISCAGSSLEAADAPAARTLSNGKLTVTVVDPASSERYYRGVRFSSIASVTQVAFRDRTYLFAPEEHNPMTDAAGLPMEFDLFSPDGPPGFKEAREGEGFVKIGVGVLVKTGDQYRFFTPYEVAQWAPTESTWTADSVTFKQICEGANAYAYRLDAEVRLSGNDLILTCRLLNTGRRPFTTEQYVHNFFVFEGGSVGPGYQLALSSPFEARIPKPVFEVHGQDVRLFEEITQKMKAAEVFMTPSSENSSLGKAVVTAKESERKIAIDVSEPVRRLTLHASSRYFCPEQFIQIHLEPGEAREWTRTYRFE